MYGYLGCSPTGQAIYIETREVYETNGWKAPFFVALTQTAWAALLADRSHPGDAQHARNACRSSLTRRDRTRLFLHPTRRPRPVGSERVRWLNYENNGSALDSNATGYVICAGS